jgi:hypothetical protein
MTRMKDIAGYEGLYAITEDGRVWSYPKPRNAGAIYGGNRNQHGMWMKPYIQENNRREGYQVVALRKDKVVERFLVHRLVAEAFIPNPENKPQVNHKHEDGDKARNTVDNLEWATNKENSDHSFKVGLVKKPLTAGEVTELRKICKFHSCRKVAFAYGRHPVTIWAINKGLRYQEVAYA